jgi:hypothetical protein
VAFFDPLVFFATAAFAMVFFFPAGACSDAAAAGGGIVADSDIFPLSLYSQFDRFDTNEFEFEGKNLIIMFEQRDWSNFDPSLTQNRI